MKRDSLYRFAAAVLIVAGFWVTWADRQTTQAAKSTAALARCIEHCGEREVAVSDGPSCGCRNPDGSVSIALEVD